MKLNSAKSITYMFMQQSHSEFKRYQEFVQAEKNEDSRKNIKIPQPLKNLLDKQKTR